MLIIGAGVECPMSRIRLIHLQDVASSDVQHGGSRPFSALLSPSPLFSVGYFNAFRTPNIGELVFNKDLVLIGLSTQGYQVSSTVYYVSEFTLQYSNSTEGEYNTFPNVRLVKLVKY